MKTIICLGERLYYNFERAQLVKVFFLSVSCWTSQVRAPFRTFYQWISPRTVPVSYFVLSITVHWADDKIGLSLNKTETLTLDQSPSSWRRKRRSLWSPGKICRHGGIQRCPAQCPGCRRWSCLWRGGRVRTASSWERCPPQPVFWSRPADGVTRHSPVIQDSGWDRDECY